jgi:hypothetical protein
MLLSKVDVAVVLLVSRTPLTVPFGTNRRMRILYVASAARLEIVETVVFSPVSQTPSPSVSNRIVGFQLAESADVML